jgi:hypothetical protein
MSGSDRKALIAAYKERPTIAGVFAVICSATGQAWVGQSRHIDTQKNGLWFSLNQGGCPYRSLQGAWRDHGEAAFRFEQLDRLPADISALMRKDELKKRAGLWTARLRAEAL